MWIDLIPWPELRDTLIQQPARVEKFYDVTPDFASLVTLEWPYSPAKLIDCDPTTSATRLSPLFQRHVLELKNWSLQRV
ncbi:hypothetical protein LTR49_027165 [Elasticomyces elasticus]|nr:hypothetical protein LTR49_027165 [Elasticomyces elasticus]